MAPKVPSMHLIRSLGAPLNGALGSSLQSLGAPLNGALGSSSQKKTYIVGTVLNTMTWTALVKHYVNDQLIVMSAIVRN